MLGGFMREVVTGGTGRSLSGLSIPVAGKTGTAELENQPSHAWFVGYAPYGNAASRQIAFAVLVENGSYGGRVAAPAVLGMPVEGNGFHLKAAVLPVGARRYFAAKVNGNFPHNPERHGLLVI